MPAVKKSSTASVALSFTKKQWTLSKARTLPSLALKIYAPAPTLRSAKMQDNYREIVLTFSSPAWPSQVSCNRIFSDATIALLGKRYRCFFIGYTTLVIRLGSFATIRAGNTISLLKDAIKARFEKIVKYTPATNVSLVGPDKKLSPVAYIYGKNILSVCEKLILSARKSTGSGGSHLKYQWDVKFSDSVKENTLHSNVTNALAILKIKLSSSSRMNTLILQPDDLSADVLYNFTLYVENFLGEVSITVFHEVKRESRNLPIVSIFGGVKQTIKASRLTKIQSRARITKCMSKSEGLNFAWAIEPSVPLDSKSSTNSYLYIYPGTLPGEEIYTLTLLVSLKSNISKSVSIDVEVYVKSSPLVARIKGGKRRVVGNNQDIILDASRSYDPDRTKGEEEWFDWECQDSKHLPCFAQDKAGQFEVLQMDSASQVTIKSGLLESNKTYNFLLSYQKGMRRKTESTQVEILEGRPPIVKMKIQKKSKENVENIVIVRGFIISHVGDMKIWVECVDEYGYSYIDLAAKGTLLTPVEIVGVGRGVRPFAVVFNKNVLDVGVIYKFKIYAKHSEGTGYSEITLTTNAPPTISMLDSELQNGTALKTEFTLSAIEGTDDPEDLPLLYNFGYFNAQNKKKYLGSPSAENSKTCKLPSGVPSNNYNLITFVDVTDTLGGMSEYKLSLIVKPPDKIDSTAIFDAMETINGALTADDLDSALGAIASSLSTFKSNALGNSLFVIYHCLIFGYTFTAHVCVRACAWAVRVRG